MELWQVVVIPIATALITSSGLWALVSKKLEKKDNETRIIVGLAHDRIIYLGMQYLKKGSITKDEYEDLYDYLYTPYKNLGGNGSAERIMEEVAKLPLEVNKK